MSSDFDLRILQKMAEDTYLISGDGFQSYDVGDDLVVYHSTGVGATFPIGLLRVTAKHPDNLQAQAILIHPEHKIIANLSVRKRIDDFRTSDLIPAYEYAVGYFLRKKQEVGRVVLVPDIKEVQIESVLDAVEPVVYNGKILDYDNFESPIKMRVICVTRGQKTARVKLVDDEWPETGTVVCISEARKTDSPDLPTPDPKPRIIRELSGIDSSTICFFEDGQSAFYKNGQLTRDDSPQEKFNPDFFDELIELDVKNIHLCNDLYTKREADKELRKRMTRNGTTTIIQGPAQSGRTSLLARELLHAKDNGAQVVYLDFGRFKKYQINSLDNLRRHVAGEICRQLGLDRSKVENWNLNLTSFLEEEVLPTINLRLLLAMDDADCLTSRMEPDDYGEFFSWVSGWSNQSCKKLWQKLNLVIVISCDIFELTPNRHHTPIRVGKRLRVANLTEKQVKDLQKKHSLSATDEELRRGQPYLMRQKFYKMVTESSI